MPEPAFGISNRANEEVFDHIHNKGHDLSERILIFAR